MYIENGNLVHQGIVISRDITYGQAKEAFCGELRDAVSDGSRAFIELKGIDFFGMRASCIVWFREGKLSQVRLMPEWRHYFSQDGEELSWERRIEVLRGIVEAQHEALGKIAKLCMANQRGSVVYRAGDLVISTIAEEFDCSYIVVIDWKDEI